MWYFPFLNVRNVNEQPLLMTQTDEKFTIVRYILENIYCGTFFKHTNITYYNHFIIKPMLKCG